MLPFQNASCLGSVCLLPSLCGSRKAIASTVFLRGFFTVLLTFVDLNSDGTVFRTENPVCQSEGVPESLGLGTDHQGHRSLFSVTER